MTETSRSAALSCIASRRLSLPNGLRVSLVHVATAPQAAVAIRVAAGSHDEPQPFGGLAHFLEHLFFLGGTAYGDDQRLMPFVHGQGGQLNATTRARDTYFFFALPPAATRGGLARLCDMLRHPAFGKEQQRREREVLHAEYLLWARATDTRCDAALAHALPPHPLFDFHAGHRHSLAVEQPAFQRALHAFHHQRYHAGQMHLVLVGPQPLDELQALAARHGGELRSAAPVAQPPPPALLPVQAQTRHVQAEGGLPRVTLVFTLEALPPASAEALDFLAVWLEQETSGGLLEQLRGAGWAESLRLRREYHYKTQAVIAIDIDLVADTAELAEYVTHAFFSWRDFFAAQDDWSTLRDEYRLLLTRRLEGMTPLALARYWAECTSLHDDSRPTPPTELSHQGLTALRLLLPQLSPQRLVRLICHPRDDAQAAQDESDAPCAGRRPEPALRPSALPALDWRLPAPNPYLRARRRACAASASAADTSAAALVCSDALPTATGTGALFLRWRHGARHGELATLHHALSAALKPLVGQARRAGVEVSFEAQGCQWSLSLGGLAQPLPDVARDALALLQTPPATAWARGLRQQRSERRRLSGELPIRQLLQRLPALVAAGDASTSGPTVPPDSTWPQRLAGCWQAAHWDGLALGFDDDAQAAIAACRPSIPGRPTPPGQGSAPLTQRYLWHDAGVAGPECALLLFCPLPVADARREALWRLLAQRYQHAFYQRLRTELQLGYAVFCGFRQVGARAGIVFAVQSPHASAGEILAHIETFLDHQRTLIASSRGAEWRAHGRTLSEQLGSLGSGFQAAAQQLWSIHAATGGAELSSYLATMRHTLHHLDATRLLASHDALQQACDGWICLANAGAPDPRWHSS